MTSKIINRSIPKKNLSFKVEPEEKKIIDQIVKRALTICAANGGTWNRTDCMMDIVACHKNGNPLELQRLLDADDFNFAHDVFGIHRHLNRETGELEDFFSPRCSA